MPTTKFVAIVRFMDLSITTPALLFPTISLLLLAYTNRFLALGRLIRELHAQFKKSGETYLVPQIISLRKRVILIRSMQFFGIISLFLSVVSMYLIFTNKVQAAHLVFAGSLIVLMFSLLISAWEIHISATALNIQIHDLEEEWNKKV